MRIVFLTLSAFSRFPAYKRAVGMGETLALRGAEVIVVAQDCAENRARMAREAPHCLPMWFQGGTLKEVWSKILVIWRLRPDVVYSTSYSVHNLACLRCLLPWKTRFIIEFSELYSRYPAYRRNWAIWEFMALLENRHVLCASQYLREHFSAVCHKWHLSRKLLYLPYAYPDYLMPSKKKDRGTVKKIVYMAALSRTYGVFEVLEAFLRLQDGRKDIELDLIGGGPDKDAVKAWVAEKQLQLSIRICGFVEEEKLNEYFSQADVFVLPMHDTIQDNARCPSKLFYYLPFRRPVVTCRVANPYEVLGKHGFYYRPEDVDDMARAFNRALSACSTFDYPQGFVERHSWEARAFEFEKWIAS